MTQEELAARARVSARTLSDGERGLRTLVHHDTARRLTSALGLGDEQRRGCEVLARAGPHGRRPLPTPSGLPTPLTPCLGRFKELEAIKGALLGGDVRLLTLTGPGGIGKTRLGVEAAREIEPSCEHGECHAEAEVAIANPPQVRRTAAKGALSQGSRRRFVAWQPN